MKYRQRPPVVDAVQAAERTPVQTKNGPVVANRGDYIVTAENGEVSVCRPDVFLRNYEPFEVRKS